MKRKVQIELEVPAEWSDETVLRKLDRVRHPDVVAEANEEWAGTVALKLETINRAEERLAEMEELVTLHNHAINRLRRQVADFEERERERTRSAFTPSAPVIQLAKSEPDEQSGDSGHSNEPDAGQEFENRRGRGRGMGGEVQRTEPAPRVHEVHRDPRQGSLFEGFRDDPGEGPVEPRHEQHSVGEVPGDAAS